MPNAVGAVYLEL